MTPPLTGFFMKAVGLGEAHKQIEAEKRAREDAANRRDFNRRRKQKLEKGLHLRHRADVYDRSLRTGPPSTSDARNQHFANGLPTSSRSDRDARRAINGPPHSTHGSTLDGQSSPPLSRVHRNDISQDTLAEYGLPWHWDKKDKNYIIIEMSFSERKLEEFRRHTIRHREQLELNKSAIRATEEVEKIKKWRKSIEPIQQQWEPERRHGRDPEQGSERGLQDRDRGRGRVQQSGTHMNARQADYDWEPERRQEHGLEQGSMRGLQEHGRRRARVPQTGAHLSTRQADHVRPAPKDPSPPQKFRKRPSLVPQKPDGIELPAPRTRSPTPQFQEVRPNPRYRSQSSAGAGLDSRSTGPWYPEEHTLTDQPHQASPRPHGSQHRARYSQAPIKQLPSRSASIARQGYGKSAAENTRQLPLRSARAPVRLGRERGPSMRGPEPRWETKPRSATSARGERGYSVAGTARQFPSQRSRGPIPLARERAPSSVRESEPKRGFPLMAESLFDDRDERGRR